MKKERFQLEAIHFLEGQLKGQKPGIEAQLNMVTHPRSGHRAYFEVEDTSTKAGVLVLFYPWKDQLYLVFTRRTDRMNFHQAQISFPGGKQEKRESSRQAAVREAHEELNIHPESIRILGDLTPLYIPPSNYCIYPVVALAENRPDFKPAPYEVAEVIEVPVDHFLNTQNIRKELWTIRKVEVEVPFYYYQGHKIWGATAMVLAELIELLNVRSKQ